MSRPLQRKSAVELDAMVREAVTARDLARLTELRDELICRSTQKAADLHAKVEEALWGQESGTSGTADPCQLDLVPPSGPAALRWQPASPPAAAPETAEPARPVAQRVAVQMGAQEAAKVLGVAGSASWDAVEKARRALVAAALAKGGDVATADRVNAAYQSLATSRCYRQVDGKRPAAGSAL